LRDERLVSVAAASPRTGPTTAMAQSRYKHHAPLRIGSNTWYVPCEDRALRSLASRLL
jgi:hypothetical protein